MSQGIAIVGIGGVFPQSLDLDRYWDLIEAGRCASQDMPADRSHVPMDSVFAEGGAKPDKIYSKRGCYVDHHALTLDYQGLAVDPDLVEKLDPMFKLGLVAARRALDDAALSPEARLRTAVIIGNIVLPTEKSSALAREYLGRALEEAVLGETVDQPLGTDPRDAHVAGLPGGVIAQAFGLGGGSFTLDAACASSLYALKLAGDELLAGRVDAVLTGGLSRPDCLYTQMGFAQLKALSAAGLPRPFDSAGDGLVVGEGAGLFVLKRLDDAIAAGDRIYATLAGVGLSNDLDGSLLAPSSEGQLRAMRAAYQRAGWQPHEVDLIECHATGTPLGDQVEFDSLCTLFNEKGDGEHVIGSVKSNIGHLLTCAGAAALMKVILAMGREILPPTANFESSRVQLDGSPFRVLTSAEPWVKKDRPRRAAISAFGFGGINAHVLVEQWEGDPQTVSAQPVPQPEAVAVVGLDARFGPFADTAAFRRRVLQGGDGQAQPATRLWGIERNQWFLKQGMTLPNGFYLNQLDLPLTRFRIPPIELKEMLPQQLAMLLSAADALEDAGLEPQIRPRAGVYVGIGLDLNTTNFQVRWGLADKARAWLERLGISLSEAEFEEWLESVKQSVTPALNANRTIGALGGMVASRIARELRFGGAGFTLSSEDASGMHALAVAVRALQDGSVDLALAGAVDFAGDLRAMMSAGALRPHSPNGEAKPFDLEADGALPGEGAASFVLKRLADAEADGDRIYAVIRGIGNKTGDPATSGSDAYAASLKMALDEAGVGPESIGYVECHASGRPAEDSLEAQALQDIFGETRLPLGSHKGDIGHSGAAAGLAGLAKTCLALYHQRIPALRGFTKAAVAGPWYPDSPFAWLRNAGDGPRRAVTANMSIDGNCNHVVLEAAHAQPLAEDNPGSLFFVEGDDAGALKTALADLAHRAADAESFDALTVQSTARTNPELSLALAFLAGSTPELLELIDVARKALEAHPQDPAAFGGLKRLIKSERVWFTQADAVGPVAFVFPGSGSHFKGMGRQLALHWPEVYDAMDQRTSFLADQLNPAMFWSDCPPEVLNRNHNVLLSAQVAFGIGVSDLVRSFGVSPTGVIGYSLGETAGFFSLGAWTERDEMHRRMTATDLFTRHLAGPCESVRQVWNLPEDQEVDWSLGVVTASPEAVREALAGRERVYLLIINTHTKCVIGGDRSAVQALVKDLGARFFALEGVVTVHCDVAKPVATPYRDLHVHKTTPPKGVKFYSGAKGKSYRVTKKAAADAILAQALDGVDFPKTIETAYADGFRTFIEMGPANSCTRMIREILGDRPHTAVAAHRPGKHEAKTILCLLGRLIAQRLDLDLSPLKHGDRQPDRPVGPVTTMQPGAPPIQISLPKNQPQATKDWDTHGNHTKDRDTHGNHTKDRDTHGNHTKDRDTHGNHTKDWDTHGNHTKDWDTQGNRSQEVDTHGNHSKDWDTHGIFPAPDESNLAEPSPLRLEPAAFEPSAPSFQSAMEPVSALGTPIQIKESNQAMTLVEQMKAADEATARAHEAYLDFAANQQQLMTANLQMQMNQLAGGAAVAVPQSAPVALAPEPIAIVDSNTRPLLPGASANPAFDREMCMEFAIGSIGRMLGPDFAHVDQYPTRVRLPDEPLMLVDRIVEVSGETMSHGVVVTEHDIHPDMWYLDHNRIPTCIAVEAGQADLFLSGYLGIDSLTKGLAVYRLLDAVVTFHDQLPGPGKVIRYDIRIERFFQQGGSHFFRFNFEGSVDGKPLLTMTEGCAGFFSAQDLEAGKGIFQTALQTRKQPGKRPADWRPFTPMSPMTLDEAGVQALRQGDLAAAFGPAFAGLPLQDPVHLPGGAMRLVDRITALEPEGGQFGLGFVRGEADIHPDDWFITCHFIDDRVMPGTLMYECCLHTLRVFLMRMGWVCEHNEVVCQPVEGVASRLKCRGQVLEDTQKTTYEVTIKEMGYGPEPYVIVNALMFSDDKPIVEITDMSLRMSGVTRERLEQIWSGREFQATPADPVPVQQPVRFNREQVLAYAVGNPSECFGEPYRVFDGERILARLPGPPFMFVDRVTRTDAEPWDLSAGGEITCEYDIPADVWYFETNRQQRMPFVVMLEIALQPCGFFAAYMGSALTSETDLSFRNLGGSAVWHRQVFNHSGSLRMTSKVTRISKSGGMIIQNFDFCVSDDQGVIYEGDTYFGFFSKAALANQVGFRDAVPYEPQAEALAVAEQFTYPSQAPFPADDLRMVDRVSCYLPTGGPNGLGFIRGMKKVDPTAWFFKAHFYQDPVIPGSLGLESFLQLLKVHAVRHWDLGADAQFETVASGEKHSWGYRGQVIPKDDTVTVQAVITRVDEASRTLWAEGWLIVDGRIIYQMTDFSLRLV